MTWPSDRRLAIGSEAGFSLVETLVVLAIVSLAAAVAAPAFLDPSGGRALDRSAREISALLREARSEAIVTSSDSFVQVDMAAKRISASWTDDEIALPDDTAIQVLTAREELVTSDRAGFRFFADGGATGGEVRFSRDGSRVRIGIDWLTGRIDRGEVALE